MWDPALSPISVKISFRCSCESVSCASGGLVSSTAVVVVVQKTNPTSIYFFFISLFVYYQNFVDSISKICPQT